LLDCCSLPNDIYYRMTMDALTHVVNYAGTISIAPKIQKKAFFARI
jgi:hypothetical protein